MSPRGTLVVLEGIDGSGTTTQARLLCQQLRARGVDAVETREPSAGVVGRFVRELLTGARQPTVSWDAMALLFAADRLDHISREVAPALERGATVVSDRYDLSTLAYQSLTAPEGSDPVEWLRSINGRAPRPDLTLVLDVSPEVAERRRRERGGEPELYEKTELQRRLAALYARAEQLVVGDRVLHIDGGGTLDEVAARILECVLPLP